MRIERYVRLAMKSAVLTCHLWRFANAQRIGLWADAARTTLVGIGPRVCGTLWRICSISSTAKLEVMISLDESPVGRYFRLHQQVDPQAQASTGPTCPPACRPIRLATLISSPRSNTNRYTVPDLLRKHPPHRDLGPTDPFQIRYFIHPSTHSFTSYTTRHYLGIISCPVGSLRSGA